VVPVHSANHTFQQAIAALNARQFADAERLFRRVLRSQPNHAGALNLLTVVLMNKGRFSEAETFIARAVALGGASDVSHYNYGLTLKQLNRPAEALQQFSQAAAINPTVPETFNNRGTVFNALGQYENAISDFDRAIALDPKSAAAHCNRGKSLAKMKRHGEALASYDEALAREPGLIAAWLGRGDVLTDLKRYDEALAAYDDAPGKSADLGEAWVGRGNVFHRLKRYDVALAAYDKALALEPAVLGLDENLAIAWFGRGCVLTARRRHGEAFAAFDKAFALDAELIGLQGARLNSKIQTCDWADLTRDIDRQIKSVRDKKTCNPFYLLAIPNIARGSTHRRPIMGFDELPAAPGRTRQDGGPPARSYPHRICLSRFPSACDGDPDRGYVRVPRSIQIRRDGNIHRPARCIRDASQTGTFVRPVCRCVPLE
jgi:tetratricopeptide (TPR) repeat protein